MPIIINHAPDISLVASVAHGAGRGEFDKWIYGENVKREAEKTQAFLSAFGTFSSMGMQGAQMMQNKKLANRQMDLQEKLGMARLNRAKTGAAQSSALNLEQWNQGEAVRHEIINGTFPINFWQSDAVNAKNTRLREQAKGIGYGSQYQPYVDSLVASGLKGQYATQSGRSQYSNGRSNVAGQANAANQHWSRDGHLTQTLIPQYEAEIDQVLAHLSPDTLGIQGNERTRGTYSPAGIGGDTWTYSQGEAERRIRRIQAKYKSKYDKHRQSPQHSLANQYAANTEPVPGAPGYAFRRDPRGGPPTIIKVPIAGEADQQEYQKWTSDKLTRFQNSFGSAAEAHVQAWDNADAKRNEHISRAIARSKRKIENLKALQAAADDPAKFGMVDKMAIVHQELEDALDEAETTFDRRFREFKGSAIDPITGGPWTRTYPGTPSSDYMKKWNANDAFNERGFYPQTGMSDEDKLDPNNFRVPPTMPNFDTRFTQKRLHRDIQLEIGPLDDPEHPLRRVRDIYYPSPKTPTQVDEETSIFMGPGKVDKANERYQSDAPRKVIRGATTTTTRRSKSYFDAEGNLTGSPYTRRSLSPAEREPSSMERLLGWEGQDNFDERGRLIGAAGDYDELTDPERAKLDLPPIHEDDPWYGRDIPGPYTRERIGRMRTLSDGGFISGAENALVGSRRSGVDRMTGMGSTLGQQSDWLLERHPKLKEPFKIFRATFNKKTHWVMNSDTGTLQPVRANWSRAEIFAFQKINEAWNIDRGAWRRLQRPPDHSSPLSPLPGRETPK